MALALFAFVVACAYTVRADDAVASAGLALDTSAGLNYEEALVTPHVTGAPDGARLRLETTDPLNGQCVLPDLPVSSEERSLSGQSAGQMVTVDAFVKNGEETCAEAHDLLLMGRLHGSDNWLYETVVTYLEQSGTGVWTGTDYATVSNEQIVVDTKGSLDGSTVVTCTVGEVPTPRRGCVIAADVTFPVQTMGLPDPSGQRLGLTIGYADEDWQGGVRFLYVTNGAWCATPRTVCDPSVSTNWQVRVAVDYGDQLATYYVRASETNAWAILGTATGIGTDSLTELSFRGTGAITSLEGHGFDAQLIQVDVEFDGTKSLYPGCNFEQTVVTGRVVSSVVHSTDRTGGSYTVSLVDLDGNVVTTQDYAFTADGTMEFYVQATALTAGTAYRAVVDLEGIEAEVEETVTDDVAVMGRALTNESWAVSDFWMFENAETFDGAPGSGIWSGRDSAYTSDGWICLEVSAEGSSGSLSGLAFEPTNEIGESYSSLLASVRAVFDDVSLAPGATDDTFGVTVTSDGEGLAFACLDNHVWQTVSRSVATPELGVEYEFSFYVRFDSPEVDTVVTLPNGRRVTLHTATLDSALYTRLSRVRAAGAGRITDLKGVPYSTELLRIRTEFDDDALYPGMNFENSSANGWITFEKLWETDRTNDELQVVVRDSSGLVVTNVTFSYSRIDEWLRFELLLQNLNPGETYSAEIVSDAEGVVTDGTAAEDVMGRALTNANWAVSDLWVCENVRTYSREVRGSGVWSGRDCASTNGEWICVRGNSEEAELAGVRALTFLPTNELTESYATLVSSVRAVFSEAHIEFDETNGLCGVTVTSTKGGLAFACLSNGVWQTVSRSVATPELGVEYELSFHLQKDSSQVAYFVTASSGRQLRLMTVALEAGRLDSLDCQYDIVGTVDFTDLTGVPYSTELLRIRTEFDDDALYPGMNFEESTANGWITFEKLWETDRTNGTVNVVVRDVNGTIVTNETFSYAGIDERQRFEFFIQGLEAGQTYSAEIVAGAKGVTAEDDTVEDVMGRMLTNANWAVSNKWIYENARTYAGAEPGSGAWTGTDYASTNGNWICIRTDSGESDEEEDVTPVSFLPTNALDEAYTTLILSSRVIFNETSPADGDEDGFFGIMVTTTTEGLAFACLSNHVWQTVSRAVAVPELRTGYEITVYLRKADSLLGYFVRLPSGRQLALMSVRLEDAVSGLKRIDAIGSGDITDLTGVPYSTDLIRITTEFDDDALYPGMNFEETTASGYVTFEQLWETDRTNGTLCVVVRDQCGVIVDEQTFDYAGLDRQAFEIYIRNLDPGDGYSVEVVSDIRGVVSDEATAEDVMGRALTNANWAVSDKWIYENGWTFSGAVRGSGVWTGTNTATTAEEWICLGTELAEGGMTPSNVSFQPTNVLEEAYSNLVISFRAVFEEATTDLDATNDAFAVSVVSYGDGLAFACLSNHVWQVVPRTVATPQFGTEYEFSFIIQTCKGEMDYTVRTAGGRAVPLLSVATEPGLFTELRQVNGSGAGRFTDLTGIPYSTDLIRITTEFDDGTLYPGLNFEESNANGYLKFEKLWETDRTNGQFRVVVRNRDGEIVREEYFDFNGIDEKARFDYLIQGLDPGEGYSVQVDTDIKGVLDDETEVDDVMARLLTNANWAVTNKWVYENARTYDGDERGSGVWTGRGCASTTGEWICVRANTEAAIAADLTGIAFEPTNTLDESYSTLVASIRIVFPAACNDLPSTNAAAFGVTVALVDDEAYFMCLVDHVWQKIPHSVAVPELGVDYEFYVYTRIDESEMSYLLRLPDGQVVSLLSTAYEEGLFTGLHRVKVTGVGDVTDLTALPFSTDLIRIRTVFDDDALYPGTNFEQTTANGDISFEKLWETDRTNGVLCVVIRDRNGLAIDERYFTFRGVDELLRFEFLVENLQPGESYSAEVVAGIPDVDGDNASAEGFMAQVVTNGTWATSNLWVRENARTFAGEEPGTGVWTTNGISATVADGYIAIDTSAAEEDTPAGFLATNALPNHTGFEYRMALCFDKPSYGYPSTAGAFGATVLADETDESAPLRFALLTNGVWMAVDSDVYEPKAGVEYELTLYVDLRRGQAHYAVWAEGDSRAVTLVDFPLADAFAADRYRTDFYGVGRVRTLEGDGFDVRLVEVEPVCDENFLVPGTNFTETVASGTLNIRQLWLTDHTSGSFTIAVRDARGNLVKVETLTYDQLTNQSFNVTIDNLNPGEAYDVSIVSDTVGEPSVTNSFVAVMARNYGGWICEDAETFGRLKPGTGEWVVSNESAYVEGGEIRFDADLDQSTLMFRPTNDTLAVRSSQIREVRVDLNFSGAIWYESSVPPEVPSNVFAAVAVCCCDGDPTQAVPDTALSVLSSNGTWRVLEETRGKFSVSNNCTVTILCDFLNGFVRYTLEADSFTNRVHQFDLDAQGRSDFDFVFSGSGSLRTIDGDVWDAHLIRNGTNEFYDLESAILGTDDPADTLSPLWLARQYVTLPRGSFRILDTNDWLTVVFPDWYYVVKTTDGKVTVYRFNSSNNWIDYAEGGESNVVVDVERSLFFVKTPEGLSWVAALATNEWVSGRIELATNIDLTAHNWTPIAGFSGDFDGCGWRIDGLNNTNRMVGMPGGDYLFGPTNGWGRSTYGLFGTATNASLANVTFAGVAISNLADSVGALAGALAGNCTVSNVTVESGSILGVGGTVAGLAGYADFTDALTFVNNTNAALVAADSDTYGEGRAAAGILCIAGPTDESAPLGTVVVTNNVNTGVISNTLYDADLFGGNVAQILAGATPGARFGDVHLTNNVAAGSVDAFLVRSEVSGWTPPYPAVNLASAFCGLDGNETFLRALDANEPGAVAVDPVHRTARMLSDLFANGSTSHVGRVNDAMTALPEGATYVLPEGLNEWGSIRLDRDMTFDMNGRTVFMIYTNSAFEISAGVNALVKDGTIVIGEESVAFGGDTNGLSTINVLIEKMDDSDFYDRTTFLIDGEWTSLADLDVSALNGAGTVIELFDETSVSIDVEKGVLQLNGVTFMTLSEAYSFKTLKDDDGSVIGYRVILADTAENMPQLSTSVSATAVIVGVTNTRKGMTYKLQKKDSIVATSWTDVGEGVPVTADNTPVELKDESPSGTQGFYRVEATETPKSGDE